MADPSLSPSHALWVLRLCLAAAQNYTSAHLHLEQEEDKAHGSTETSIGADDGGGDSEEPTACLPAPGYAPHFPSLLPDPSPLFSSVSYLITPQRAWVPLLEIHHAHQ